MATHDVPTCTNSRLEFRCGGLLAQWRAAAIFKEHRSLGAGFGLRSPFLGLLTILGSASLGRCWRRFGWRRSHRGSLWRSHLFLLRLALVLCVGWSRVFGGRRWRGRRWL